MNNEFAEILGLQDLKNRLDNKDKLERMASGKGCVLCDYKGFSLNKDNTYSMCSCNKNSFFHEIYQKSNVPRIYWDKTVDDWNTRTDGSGNDLGMQQSLSEKVFYILKCYASKISNICTYNNTYVKHSGNKKSKLHSLSFEGNNNSGKTFIASVFVQLAIKNKLSAKYFDWVELLELMIDFSKKEELDEVVNDFGSYDFIAVDGIEHFNLNNSQIALHIDRLAKARLKSGKPIFLIGNNTMNAIQAGSGWQSLLSNCLLVRLPNAIK